MPPKLTFIRFWVALIFSIQVWAGLTNQPETVWRMQLTDERSLTPLAVSQKILVCSLLGTNFSQEIGAFATDGRLLWKRPGLSPVSIGPDGRIYFETLTGRLGAVTAENELLWVYDITRGNLISTPVIDAGNRSIFFLTVERPSQIPVEYLFLVKLSIAGEPIFYKRLPYQTISGLSGMALTKDGKLLLCADYGLNAFDDNGQLVWEYPYKIINYTPVVDAAGVAYVHDLSQLIAVNSNGTTLWQKPLSTAGTLGGPGPILAGDRIYLSSFDSLYCCSRSGSLIWQRSYQSFGNQPRVAADGMIYIEVMKETGQDLYCLNTNGEINWIFPQTSGLLLGEEGSIFVGTTNTLCAFKGTAPGPHPWAMEGRTASRRNSAAGSGFTSVTMTANGFLGKFSAEEIGQVSLQSSPDLRSWTTITNYTDLGFDRSFLSRDAATVRGEFFRLKNETVAGKGSNRTEAVAPEYQ